MYKKSVVKFNKAKYANVKNDTLDSVFSDGLEHTSVDGNLYICHTCHSTVIKGNIPCMSVKANHLELSPLPPELSAMIRQLGTLTWFFTLSAADMKWPDVIQIIAKQYGVIYTDEDVANLSFEDKSNWLKYNPVTAARHFQHRLNTFFQEFLKSTAHPLGEIEDYGIRIEFQARGSPHAQCVLWVKNAPKYATNSPQEICDFINTSLALYLVRMES